MMSFFIGSLGYTKAFKVKDRIINEIELEGEWNNTAVENNIENYLYEVGYRVNLDSQCPDAETNENNVKVTQIKTNSSYKYCVYKYETEKEYKKTVYYKVVSFMYFDIPVISEIIKIPVSGETKPFVKFKS